MSLPYYTCESCSLRFPPEDIEAHQLSCSLSIEQNFDEQEQNKSTGNSNIKPSKKSSGTQSSSSYKACKVCSLPFPSEDLDAHELACSLSTEPNLDEHEPNKPKSNSKIKASKKSSGTQSSSSYKACKVCSLPFPPEDLDGHQLACSLSTKPNLDEQEQNKSASNSEIKPSNKSSRSQSSLSYKNCKVCSLPFPQDGLDAHQLACSLSTDPNIDEQEGNEQISDSKSKPNSSSRGISKSFSKCCDSINCTHTENRSNKNKENRSSSKSYNYGMDPKRDLFPPTKKYRHYPIVCDYCGESFQPGELKKHKQEQHLNYTRSDQRLKSRESMSSVAASESGSGSRTKIAGGMPRQLQTCYICSQIYGSKSLKIHEKACLKKWKAQNDQLPPKMRAPEPVKPEPMPPVPGAEDGKYPVPESDPKIEAAFKGHLKSLIPCKHCSRTFSPDRIIRHQSCCFERPKTRECATPDDGEIPR